jgi:hypothetical protein
MNFIAIIAAAPDRRRIARSAAERAFCSDSAGRCGRTTARGGARVSGRRRASARAGRQRAGDEASRRIHLWA